MKKNYLYFLQCPAMAEAANPAVLFTISAVVKRYNGGFGSAVANGPATGRADHNRLYFLKIKL